MTGVWVKPDALPALQAYFGKIFPVAAGEYGLRSVFGLRPVSAYSGDFVPDLMFVNEWPSLEHFKQFLDDPRTKALIPQRDAAANRLVVTQYSVPQERTVTLREGDIIEFGAMWIKPGKQADLGAYYAKAVEIARKHALEPITALNPVFAYSGDFAPDRAGLNLWRTMDNFRAFANEAESIFRERDAALNRLVVTHAAVQFAAEADAAA
ncbi:MAG: hypothetical protein R3B13_13850 [Polyangiaceae bacterium]